MKGISVMLPKEVEGRELQNVITEVAQEVLGEIVIKGEAQQGYIPGPIRKVFIGSKISMTLPVMLAIQTKKLFGGYKTKKEEHTFQFRIDTALGDDYRYSALEFSVYDEQFLGEGRRGWVAIDVDEEKYSSVKNTLEGFIVALYKKLVPAAETEEKSSSPVS